MAGAIAVNGAITNVDENLRRKMQPMLTLRFDTEAFVEENELCNWDWYYIGLCDRSEIFDTNRKVDLAAAELSQEHIHALGQMPQVLFYDFTVRGRAPFKSFDVREWQLGRRNDSTILEPVHIQTSLGINSTKLAQIESGAIVVIYVTRLKPNEILL